MSTTQSAKSSRTFWIWLLIIVSVLAGLSALLDALRYMGWLPVAALGPLQFFLPTASWLGAIMAFILALI